MISIRSGFQKGQRIDYIYLACQTGSDRVLKLMSRPYSVKDFKQSVESVARANDSIQLRTDIIVGHPQEEEADFYKTLELVEWFSKYKVRVQTIRFSARPRTIAWKMPGHIPDDVIKERDARINERLYQLHKKNPNLIQVGIPESLVVSIQHLLKRSQLEEL